MFRFQLRPHRRHVQLTASGRLRVHYMRRGLKDDSIRSRVVRRWSHGNQATKKLAREAREVTNSDHGAARRASGGAARGCARITLCPGAIIPADPLGKTPAIARRAMRRDPSGR